MRGMLGKLCFCIRWRALSDKVRGSGAEGALAKAVLPSKPDTKGPATRGAAARGAAAAMNFRLEISRMIESPFAAPHKTFVWGAVSRLATGPTRCRLSARRATGPSWRGPHAPRYDSGWGTCPASYGNGRTALPAHWDATASHPCAPDQRAQSARPGCGS